MSVFTITFEAKCKHCKNFASEYKTKKDGSKSKLKRYFCSKGFKSWNLDFKDKACDKFEI